MGGITWGPLQVSFYAALFDEWLDRDRDGAQSAITAMLEQRRALRLAPAASLALPLEVIPVLAIGVPVHAIARQRAAIVQEELLAAQLGWSNLELWEIQDDGTPAQKELSRP